MLLMSEPLMRNVCPVAKSYLTLCDTHGLRLPCPSLFPGVCSDSCLLSQWCYLTISSFANPFSSCPQSFPASGSFPASQPFTSGGQKCWSWSFSISPSSEYSGLISLRIDWLISLQPKKTLKSRLQHHNLKVSVLAHSASFMVLLSYLYMTTGKTIPLTIWSFVSEVMSLLFNIASRLVIAFFFQGASIF